MAQQFVLADKEGTAIPGAVVHGDIGWSPGVLEPAAACSDAVLGAPKRLARPSAPAQLQWDPALERGL
jgi:hypothetical protein